MAGFANDASLKEIVQCDNVDFSGNAQAIGQITADGQLLIGSSISPNIRTGTLGSSDGSITWTLGHGTISGQVASGSTVIKTITGNSNGVEAPLGGNFNILGTGSITVVGSANTETVQLTGITNHAIQIGAGTATLTQLGAGTTGQVLQTNTGADPTWSTATYPSTTTINQILYSSANNVVGGLATVNQGVLTTGATGIPVITALATNGQLIIGSTAGVPAAATLTPGAGIAIVNGSNSITISATGAGFNWQTTSASVANMVKDNGYIAIAAGGALTFGLPATAGSTIGDTVYLTLDGATSWQVTQALGQQIRISGSQTTSGAGGSITSTAQGDTIELVYQGTGRWNAISFIGNLTVT